MPTGVFKEPGERQDRRHGTHRYFGSDRLHTLRATTLLINTLVPTGYIRYTPDSV
jgi:hypothetical protein